MPLTMLGNGQECTVQRITGKDEVRAFLKSLGFVEGGTVSVVNEVGGDLIVNVKGSRIALSRGMANRILVS
ncbi:MAG TPA: ferrous iron transport protein A [Clostridiales bacterium]|nr:ferrous iron transport protein A [Clostridiales bacterium]